jgi:hypothetical protein
MEPSLQKGAKGASPCDELSPASGAELFHIRGHGGRPTAYPLRPAFSAMFSRAIFEDLDFPAMALVVCLKEKVAHKFDRLTHRRRSKEAATNVIWELRKGNDSSSKWRFARQKQ